MASSYLVDFRPPPTPSMRLHRSAGAKLKQKAALAAAPVPVLEGQRDEELPSRLQTSTNARCNARPTCTSNSQAPS